MERSLVNFPIDDCTMPIEIIHVIAVVKKAAAFVNVVFVGMIRLPLLIKGEVDDCQKINLQKYRYLNSVRSFPLQDS